MSAAIPVDIGPEMPSRAHLKDVLAASVCVLRRGTWLVRTARAPAFVLPHGALTAYRWGPPKSARDPAARLPYHWLYVAEDVATAVWEGRFCERSEECPGFFYVQPDVAESGIVALFRLEDDVRLLELGGTTGARLGIFDRISDPDHTWCQHFGVELHHILAELHADTGAIGIRYPSRRLRNHSAIAIHSRHLAAWRRTVTVRTMRFGDMPFHRELCRDPCYLPPGGQQLPADLA
jgi:hypothetical protein